MKNVFCFQGPGNSCDKRNFCYVAKDSQCLDKWEDKGGIHSFSELACNSLVHNGGTSGCPPGVCQEEAESLFPLQEDQEYYY